jgi:hypothetical protein
MFRDMFREAGFEARRGQQSAAAPTAPTWSFPPLPDFHWEIKFCQVVKIKDWMAQAVRDAGDKPFPVSATSATTRSPWPRCASKTFSRSSPIPISLLHKHTTQHKQTHK